MIRSASLLVSLGCLASFVLAARSPAAAQDPAKVSSGIVTVKVDNDQVRVLDAVLEPGEKEKLHSHPANVVYVVSGGKLRVHKIDGTVVDTILSTGDVFYRGPVTHWAENVGDTTLHVIVVELKHAGK
jgi:quercetin dioxygenase-like cupin family protein